MKPFLGIAGFLLILSATATAQGTNGQSAKVSDADMKKLSDAFATLVKTDDILKKDQAREELRKEIERIDGSLKPATLLSMPDAWTEVFYAKRSMPKSPSGLGRVVEKSIQALHAGRPVEFKYGLILPNGFDPRKRYPLVIALHDKPSAKDQQVTGPRYLEEVWMKLPKEERDQYIFVAPTMGPSAAGKEFRVEWGDILHMKSLALPLKEMLMGYPVDNDRLFLEGTGEGGEFALHFALSKPQFWAGVAVRSALPRFPQVVTNGATLPVLVNVRAATPGQARPAQISQLLANLDHAKKTHELPLEVKEYPAPDKPAKGPFASDVIPEATAAIAAFFGSKKRDVVPRKISFVTDSPHFAECYWVRLRKFETEKNYSAKINAKVDAGSNTIDVQTEFVESFRIYLNDRLVNMDAPVKITVNGQPHTERQFTRSPTTLVKYFEDNPIDPGFQPTATVDIEVPAAASTQPTTDTKPSEPPK